VLLFAGIQLIFFIVASKRLRFSFLLKTMSTHRDVFIIAEQGLHRVKASSVPHLVPPASRLGVHNKLGENTAETADTQLTKGVSHTI